jgi:heavy metal efflux system protein
MRMNELISGVKGDVVVKVFGDDMDKLLKAGQKVADLSTRVPGVEGVNLERIAGLPFLTIEPKREAISRYGLSVNEVQEIIEAAIAGQVGLPEIQIASRLLNAPCASSFYDSTDI